MGASAKMVRAGRVGGRIVMGLIAGVVSLATCTDEDWHQDQPFEVVTQRLTYTVNPGTGWGSIPGSLQPGDVVNVNPGTYGPVKFTRAGTAANPIIIQGIPDANGNRPVISGNLPPDDSTVMFASSHHMVFQGFEVTAGNRRCVYNQANNITMRNTVVRNCPEHGILGADFGSGTLVLEQVEVHHCGLGDFKHQVYIATDEESFPGSVFRMKYCYLHDGNGGHGVKSRAERNELYYNWIEGSAIHELELIGSAEAEEPVAREDSDVVGNVIRKTTTGGHLIRIGGDGTGQSWGRYRFVNNTFIQAPSPNSGSVLRLYDGVDSVEAHNNVFYRAGGGTMELVRTADATGGYTIFGTRNWVPAGSTIPTGWSNSFVGPGAPGFTNEASFDLRPASGSPLVDNGQSDPPTIVGKEFPSPLRVPMFEPPVRSATQNPTAARRAGSDPIDIGAYEGAGGPPVPCQLVGQGWVNTSFTSQDGTFTAEFDATPSVSSTDAVVGLTSGSVSAYSGLAANIRFANTPNNHIDARTGNTYTGSVPYTANTTYHMRLVVNVAAKTYSAYVTPAGGSEQTLGVNLAFRTEQNTVTSLNNWAGQVDPAASGTVNVCNFTATPSGGGGGGGTGNLLPDGGFESSKGGGGITDKDYYLTNPPVGAEGVTRSTVSPLAGAASLHLVINNQHYSEAHDRTAADLTQTGNLTAKGKIRNNGASPITVRLSVGYFDAGWVQHMTGADYTLSPGTATDVSQVASIPAGTKTQFAHWIKCTSASGCDLTWDTAYLGFNPPP
jgi:hypothetical protein